MNIRHHLLAHARVQAFDSKAGELISTWEPLLIPRNEFTAVLRDVTWVWDFGKRRLANDKI